MTREEAIFCEKSYIGETNCTDCKYYGTDTCKSRESHKMAIKALEQEPTPNASYCKLEDCISRDGAIEVLKDWDGYFIGHSSDDVVKALNLAIKALEHPEKNVVAVVPCGDAISREEVLKLMKDNWHTHNGDWAMQESMDDIRVLPSVTPQEPRKGHWIEHIAPNNSHYYDCSLCGCVAPCTEFADSFLWKLSNFCPDCGAKMKYEEAIKENKDEIHNS